MIVAESDRPHDCMRIALASILELDVDAFPYIGDVNVADSPEWLVVWATLRDRVAALGWGLSWTNLDEPWPTLPEYVDAWGDGEPFYWIACATHPSWPAGYGHALVMLGPEIVVWPPTGTADPPLDELSIAGVCYLLPLDPARFVLRRNVLGMTP